MINNFAHLLALLGAFLMCVAALGILRFPDVYCRMHAASKAGSLGLGLLLLAIILRHPQPDIIIKCIAIILFIFLTNPIAAHMVSRAAYLHKIPLWKKTGLDELEGKYAKKAQELKS